jgi:hypothetical protein
VIVVHSLNDQRVCGDSEIDEDGTHPEACNPFADGVDEACVNYMQT